LTLSTAGIVNPTITYAITGATTATGTGAAVTKGFAIGLSTITWTVTDAANGTRNASTTVTVNELPKATISTSVPDVFCDELAVMAKSSHTGNNSYAWTYGNTSYATTQIIDLDNSVNDGNYTVKITDKNGCVSSPVSYNYQKQNTLGSYTLLAYKSVTLDYNNDLLSGSIGVMNAGGTASIQTYSSIPDPGFVKAPNISLGWWECIPNKYYAQAVVTLPAMLTNSAITNTLTSTTKTSNGTVTGNYKNVTINNGIKATLTGSAFHKITINQSAQVTFTSGDISIDTLIINDNATVSMNQNVNFRISKAVTVGNNVTLNSSSQKVTFFMSDAVADITKFTVGYNTNMTANIFMPHGDLDVADASNNYCWRQSGSCCSHNHNNCCNSNSGTFMIGFYICERITAGQNVTWDNFTCLNVPVNKNTKPNNLIGTVAEAKENSIGLYPNPSTGAFNVVLPQNSGNAVVRVLDITGKEIFSTEVAQGADRNQKLNIGHVAPGMYLVDVTSGTNNYKSKLVIE
jgi:hypothetical protein